MADLVRVHINGKSKNMGRAHAKASGAEVVDEPTHNPDGTLRGTTTAKGRRVKKKTTVDESATAKKAAVTSAPDTKEQA